MTNGKAIFRIFRSKNTILLGVLLLILAAVPVRAQEDAPPPYLYYYDNWALEEQDE